MKKEQMTPEVFIRYKDDPSSREEFIRFIVEYFLSKDTVRKVGDD